MACPATRAGSSASYRWECWPSTVSANYALRGAVLGLLDSAGVQQPSMLVVPLSDIHTRRVNVEQHHQ
jgi:hypothetical protein